jgi:3D (Asp-Asp-Asp) domain-containing protein/peptidoglycan hydrolase CwlO-like protein
VVVVPAAVADTSGSPGSRAQQLRQENGALAARSSSAALTLYGLDSRLSRVQSELASLQAQQAQLAKKRRETRKRVKITRQVLNYSEAKLGERLRALYQQGEADPLEVLLGSTSLDAAMTSIDDLKLAAGQDQQLMAHARSSRRELARLSRTLADRDARLRRLTASARATQASLASARAARIAYLSQLAAQQRLNRSQISSLESQAQAMQAEAQAAAVRQAATPPVGTIGVPPEPVVGTTNGQTMTVVATGYSLRGRTATGAPTGWGVVAVDPSVIPLGTSMTIPGYGSGVAADTGGGVQGAMIDLWFPSAAQAQAWGRRTVTITLH